ncbi:hypothetical protein [Mycobacterium xenopi]|uniref:Uncharacterized protein n=1 Tax=Mycobacterium xenopi TaxID=1789 RepID=A0AAD1H287_MYCXE|nr:hypothetical protein [Mycobacterium xenopi]ORX21619.1 hypothetical protein AWC32_21655 [Mycobacterium xenopi]BBU22139.1 hypothetical protein MYXE_19290 [Mycobacterium xenopi]SPX77977.1 gp78 protein [Mycobacterium xenopi]
MPRIRTIKPAFWDSPDTAAADLRTRLLYIAMWNWADDYGIGDATPVRLIGFAFPNDEIPVSDYPRILSEVSRAYGVVYFEHAGRRYFVIPEWEKHQRTEKRAKPDEALIEAANAAISAAQRPDAESPRNSAEIPPLSDGTPGAGTGEQGNRGTGEQTTTARENDEPWPPEPQDAVDAEVLNSAPKFIDNPSRPTPPKPTDAARTVVRTTLGTGYPRTTIDRLAVQVIKLAREGHPDALIREALHEWDHRADCMKAEFLPTVLGDIVKRSRAAPAANGHQLQGADLRAAENEKFKRQLRQLRQQQELP